MVGLELSENDLFNSFRDPQEHALAVRYSPILLFDAREPFLPVAAGYTIFSQDGASKSMSRRIELRPTGKPEAVMAIEYAIWWDWDIHHLYELEHVWIYVGEYGQVVRVEGSWHGEYKDLNLILEGDHAVFYSEPGKHALASDSQPFIDRTRGLQRGETLFVTSHAHVLVNSMFEGKIRRKVFDQTLVRSYLAQWAFEPAWFFDKRFNFNEPMLVTWQALEAWIPGRVNAVLTTLETQIASSQYRALRLAGTDGHIAGLQRAARNGADGVVLPVHCSMDGYLQLDFDRISGYLESVPMGAMILVENERCINQVAQWINDKKLYQYSILSAEQESWLVMLKNLSPKAVLTVQVNTADSQALARARDSGAVYINPRGLSTTQITAEWVAQAHAQGFGVVAGPVYREVEGTEFENLGIDILWVA